MIDTNGNGTISRDELKEIFGSGLVSRHGEEIWDEIMNQVDTNGDGEIQFEEFEAAM